MRLRGNWSSTVCSRQILVELAGASFEEHFIDALLKLGLKVGKEAKASPCQTIVPLYRNHVFAQIKPTTQTRIDMGFALGDMKPTGRLIDTGGFAKKDRITHRIPITSKDDIDDEVKHWLKVAYDRDAK